MIASFITEMKSGFYEYYARKYGYIPRDEKIISKISDRHFERINSDLFKDWLEQIFVPELKNLGKVF